MKVLALSDSHGFASHFAAVLEKEPDCKTVFFLGDGLGDLLQMKEIFPDRIFLAVRGNNDWERRFQAYDETAYKYIEGHTILATHGHRDGVRHTLTDLAVRTQAIRGDLALFGHTHKPTKQIVPGTGVLAVNPGALCNRQYAVLEITKADIAVNFKTI